MMLNEKYFLDFNLFCFELISDTMEKAVALLLAVERECARLELHLNTRKTKVMAFNTGDTSVTKRDGLA